MSSFRKSLDKQLRPYICTVSNLKKRFKSLYGKAIKSCMQVTNEDCVVVDDKGKLPIGVLYKRNGNMYAMGVCDHCGTFPLDEFTVQSISVVKYSLWGPYQRVRWTVRDIQKNLVWRARLMKKPHRIDSRLVPQFEKSRWMMFCFWPEEVDELIRLELALMDDILEQDALAGGLLAKKLPKTYGCNNVEELKEYVKKQYKSTKFRLNESEIAFIENQGQFGTQIDSILKTVV